MEQFEGASAGPRATRRRPFSFGRTSTLRSLIRRGPSMAILVVGTTDETTHSLAALLLEHELQQRGVNATVSAAGLRATSMLGSLRELQTAPPATSSLFADNGRDLVLAMSPEHVQLVRAIDPKATDRTFCLSTLARSAPPWYAPVPGLPEALRQLAAAGAEGHEGDEPTKTDAELRRVLQQVAAFISRCVLGTSSPAPRRPPR